MSLGSRLPLVKTFQQTLSDWDYTVAEKCMKALGCQSPEEVAVLVQRLCKAVGVELETEYYWNYHPGMKRRVSHPAPAKWEDRSPRKLSVANVLDHLVGKYDIFVYRVQNPTQVMVFDLDIKSKAVQQEVYAGVPGRIDAIHAALAAEEVRYTSQCVRSPSGGCHLYVSLHKALAPFDYGKLLGRLDDRLGFRNGYIEVFPRDNKPLRFPFGVRSALLDRFGVGLIHGANILPSKTKLDQFSLRRNLNTTLRAFLAAYEATAPKETPKASPGPVPLRAAKYTPKGRKLSDYHLEMASIELGITDYGQRYLESGRMLWNLVHVKGLSADEAFQAFSDWLHLGTHVSKDLSGPSSERIRAQMLRSARTSIARLTQGRVATRTPSFDTACRAPFKYLAERNVNSVQGAAFRGYESLSVQATIPYTHLHLETRLDLASVLAYLQTRVHGGAGAELWLSHKELHLVLGSGKVTPEESAALPEDLPASIRALKTRVALSRALLTHYRVLRQVKHYQQGKNVYRYEVALDKLTNPILPPTDPVQALLDLQEELCLTQKSLAGMLGISPSQLSMIINRKRKAPAEVLWMLCREATITQTLQGGAASVTLGDRIMTKKKASQASTSDTPLQVVRQEDPFYEAFTKATTPAPGGLKPQPRSEPMLTSVPAHTALLATEMPPGFDTERLELPDMDKLEKAASQRLERQLAAEHPDLPARFQHQLVSVLRINPRSPEDLYYGFLPKLPEFPKKPVAPLHLLTGRAEHYEAEVTRVLRAYNRITSQKYPEGFMGIDLPRAHTKSVKEALAKHMVAVLQTLADTRVTPERWVAFYLHHYVKHAKQPVHEFPAWWTMFNPHHIRSVSAWCNRDNEVPEYAAGVRGSCEYLPRTDKLRKHYFDMIQLLGFAVLPTDEYVQHVLHCYFPGDTFYCEVAYCLEEYDAAQAELQEKLSRNEWIWS